MARTELGDITELRADRALLNPLFDHYLLSNRKSELRKIELPNGAYYSSLSPKQFGLQHATLYSRVERLVLDLFNSSPSEDHLYTFVEGGSLIKLIYKSTIANFVSVNEIASVNLQNNRSDALPPSLIFPDIDCALTSNGSGQLTVYNTQNRVQDAKWEPIVSYVVFIDEETDTVSIAPFDNSTNVTGLPFLITDVRRTSNNVLSILLESVSEKKRSQNATESVEFPLEKTPFYSRLVWLDLDLTQKSIIRTREAHFNAHLELATLNHDATEIITVGATNPTFVFDSLKPIEGVNSMDVDEQKSDSASDKKPLYVWSQDAEEINVTFALAESIRRSDVVYNLTSQEVDVEIKGVKVLSGKLEGMVHLDSSTYIIHDNSLQITLFKARGHFWRELVVGDTRGLYQPDPQLISNALESLEKFTSETQENSSRGAQSTFNNEQLEECDNTGEETKFICFTDGDTHNCIKTMDASCSQLLFETRTQAGGPKAIATRQDHDGIVWSLNKEDLDGNKRILHKYTLDAYGYVQAGHAQKLYSGCSPDGNFATVIHANHHVFVYLQSVPVSSDFQLTNRKTKQQHKEVKEQLVINTAGLFEQNDILNTNFIGFTISNNILYLLTRSYVIACHVKA